MAQILEVVAFDDAIEIASRHSRHRRGPTILEHRTFSHPSVATVQRIREDIMDRTDRYRDARKMSLQGKLRAVPSGLGQKMLQTPPPRRIDRRIKAADLG